MKYFKITDTGISGYIQYASGESEQALKDKWGEFRSRGIVFTEITKLEYDTVKEKERLVKLVETGSFNTALTTYFNSVYRRANNLPDTFYEHLTIDGNARTKKQILNSISGLAVDSKYIIAYDGKPGFVPLPDGQIDIYLKDIFAIEENYKTSKNPEWQRLVKIIEIQQAIEEKFVAPDSSILKLIHQLMYINLQGTEHVSQVPDISGIDWGSLVSGGTT